MPLPLPGQKPGDGRGRYTRWTEARLSTAEEYLSTADAYLSTVYPQAPADLAGECTSEEAEDPALPIPAIHDTTTSD